MSVHELARQIRTGQHIPDILDCLAQLSNDEVPTPPKLARAMLDILPDDIWSKVDYVWLDPFCKSGIFLREAAARLLEGLSDQIPNFNERRDHIYRDMLWGTSITEMTGMISRRSLYYSRDASGPASVVHFDDEAGNVPFVRAHHTFPKKKDGTVTGGCEVCGATLDLERGEARENYAYSFIHDAYPTEEMHSMKFDVIVGNPPYQLESGGHGAQAKPVYQHFVLQAIGLDPRYVVMVTPSRWFTGGFGLDSYRDRMIADRRLAKLVDNPKLFDCFPGVEIKGGVSFFLWDREHDGDCEFSTRINGVVRTTTTRDLRAGDGVVVRDNGAASIIEKARAVSTTRLSSVVSTLWPFTTVTNAKGLATAAFEGAVPTLFSSGVRYLAPSAIQKNAEWINRWKVLVPKAGDGHGREVSYVIGEPIALAPGSACSGTYLVAGLFDSRHETENFANYLASKLVRFLVLQRKTTQDLTQDCFRFVPMLDMTRAWSDSDLYTEFGLTDEEVAYVEGSIQEREVNLSLDSPIPASHMLGGAKYKSSGGDAND